MSASPRVGPAMVPRLARGVRLQFIEPRGQWIVQAPERVLMPDEIAVAVLQRCDGATDVAGIAAALAEAYQAPLDVVTTDVVEMLQDLADKGVVEDAGA
jgi:pyrroloquinoline quinone biosynthesis protein D